MFSTKYEPIPFHRWFEENREELDYLFGNLYEDPSDSKCGECGECGGRGYVVCDYNCEHDCEECDGKGDLDREDQLKAFAHEAYRVQVRDDFKKAQEYIESCLLQKS